MKRNRNAVTRFSSRFLCGTGLADNLCGALRRPIGAATDSGARHGEHSAFFWLAITVLVTALFAPPATSAQKCKGNINTGCSSPGAVCSPVTSGVGATGRCKNVAGLPRGERECDCAGTPVPPPPTLDPKCSDRTAMGKIECRINQPVVTQHETVYPMVVFAPGDIVDVTADGCVQTGGFGNTWKRYVNPSGADSARLYHGLVRIPTGTKDSALVRINSVIGRHLQVTGTGVPVSQLKLHLGYEDDGYSDNGYYSHDDGTEDQCKNDPSQGKDGGPAHVTVTIYRGVSPDATGSRFDFDVVSSGLDSNGLPYNPLWSWQTRPENQGKIPDTSMCHNFSTRGSTLGVPDEFMSPYLADCTDQADMSTVDQPIELNATLCNYGTTPYLGDTFAGHVNWFPLTIEGNAGWGDHSGYPFPFGDDDYTFTYTSEGQSNPLSVNGRSGLHVEFDSDETIDNFTSDEWVAFHQAVDNDNARAKLLFGGHTILTGMFGLDGEHGMKAELHPLYALATRRDGFENDPTDEVWLMFVRNQGDEGYCSSQIWDAGFEDYTFRLPWLPGMVSVDVNWDKTQFVGTDGTSGPTVSVLPPPSQAAGVYVKFHLGPAVRSSYAFDPGASIPFINGALHLIWGGTRVAHPVAPTRAGSLGERGVTTSSPSRRPPTATAGGAREAPIEVDDVEQKLRAAINQLPAAQRPQVEKARFLASTRTAAVHRLSPTRSVTRMTQPPPVPRIARLHAIKAGPATRKLARDEEQMRALCAASHNAPAGLPAKVCAGNVRDHR
jgi:hypothetical protein